MRWISRRICETSRGIMPSVGSSRMMSFGRIIRQRAIASILLAGDEELRERTRELLVVGGVEVDEAELASVACCWLVVLRSVVLGVLGERARTDERHRDAPRRARGARRVSR